MKLKNMPSNKIYPGMKIRLLSGRIGTLLSADSKPDYLKQYGPSPNNVSFDGDDGWLFFKKENDDWEYHGCYLGLCELEVIEE